MTPPYIRCVVNAALNYNLKPRKKPLDEIIFIPYNIYRYMKERETQNGQFQLRRL